ncbi:MAG: hypothetical protein M3X11_12935 [Acidobacteriota bacterium]|nr:hypothetical protein [Acidobacteriota bacterium]
MVVRVDARGIISKGPAYSEWTRLIGNDPAKKFRMTKMKLPYDRNEIAVRSPAKVENEAKAGVGAG